MQPVRRVDGLRIVAAAGHQFAGAGASSNDAPYAPCDFADANGNCHRDAHINPDRDTDTYRHAPANTDGGSDVGLG